MAREAEPARVGAEQYAKTLRGAWQAVFDLLDMPLDRIALLQSTTIAEVKVRDPVRWARAGKKLEDDAIVVEELTKMLRAVEQRIPELRRTAGPCASLSSPSSDLTNSRPKNGAL